MKFCLRKVVVWLGNAVLCPFLLPPLELRSISISRRFSCIYDCSLPDEFLKYLFKSISGFCCLKSYSSCMPSLDVSLLPIFFMIKPIWSLTSRGNIAFVVVCCCVCCCGFNFINSGDIGCFLVVVWVRPKLVFCVKLPLFVLALLLVSWNPLRNNLKRAKCKNWACFLNPFLIQIIILFDLQTELFYSPKPFFAQYCPFATKKCDRFFLNNAL